MDREAAEERRKERREAWVRDKAAREEELRQDLVSWWSKGRGWGSAAGVSCWLFSQPGDRERPALHAVALQKAIAVDLLVNSAQLTLTRPQHPGLL